MAATARTNQATGDDRIVTDPKSHGGKPTVRDTGVPVERILAQLAAKPDVGDVLARNPDLTSEDIQAVMAYARTAVQTLTASNGTQPVAGVPDIWANYDPEAVGEALRQSAGALRGIDAEQFLAYLREMRGHEPTTEDAD
jgi:uncharacterized protein (DUF433 family)